MQPVRFRATTKKPSCKVKDRPDQRLFFARALQVLMILLILLTLAAPVHAQEPNPAGDGVSKIVEMFTRLAGLFIQAAYSLMFIVFAVGSVKRGLAAQIAQQFGVAGRVSNELLNLLGGVVIFALGLRSVRYQYSNYRAAVQRALRVTVKSSSNSSSLQQVPARWQKQLLAGLFIFCLLVLLSGGTRPSQAAAANSYLPERYATPPPPYGDAPTEPPDPGSTPAPPGAEPPPSIIQRIINLLVFNDSTMSEAITKALLKMFGGMLYEATDTLNGVAREVLAFLDIVGFSGGPVDAGHTMANVEALRFEAWKTLLTIAGILLPISLALTVGSAMREGTSSITGYAHAREALLEWVISVALAGASWFLISLSLQLAHYAGSGILAAFSVDLQSDPLLLREVITGSISKGDTFLTDTPLLLQLFVALFALFLIGAVAVSLALSVLARYVLLFLITTTAPVMFVLGALRPLRWLSSFWSKAIVMVILLGPMNALLLGLAMRLQIIALERTTGLVGTIFALLILVGVLSVLITINTMIGKSIYGAAIEIAQRAVGAAGQVVTLAFAIAGAAVALPALGAAAGSAGAAGSAVGVSSGPTGLSGGGGGAAAGAAGNSGARVSSASSSAHPYDAFRMNGQRGALAGEIGSILHAVNTPVTRGLGTGMRIASALHRAQSLTAFAQGGRVNGHEMAGSGMGEAADPALDRWADFSSGAPGEASARDALAQSLETGQSLLRQRGMAPDQAAQAVARGLRLGSNAMLAAQEEFGIPPGRFLQSLGYPVAGRTAEETGSLFLQHAAGAFAFGDAPVWMQQARPPAGIGRVDAQDVAAAVQILSNRPTEHALGSAEGIATIARLSYHLRQEAVYATPEDVVAGASSFGRGDLAAWMRTAYGQLEQPPAGLSEDIQRLQNPPAGPAAPPGASPA